MDAFLQFSRQISRLVPSTIGSTSQPTCLTAIRTNCHRASISRTRRKQYTRTYPVRLVQPDGSSFTIRYNSPRRILVMPINLAELTPEEIVVRYKRMDPPKRVVVEEYDDDDFDQSKYIQKMKQVKA